MVRRILSARDVLDMTAFHGARALLAAASLGVFEALSGRRATAAAVARRCGTDPAATDRLLRVLLAMRLVEQEGDKLRLTPGARELLTEEGSLSLSDLLRHRAARFKAWALLEESVRSGRPVVLAGEGEDDPLALQAARARRDSARRWAPVLAAWVDFGSARTLLFLGDGPAVYAHHFARAKPKIQITVVDTPASIAVGRDYLRGRPEAKRIRLVQGDPWKSGPPSGRWDAAFLSDALHSASLDSVRRLLRRLRKSLRPKGLCVIRDRFLEDRGPFPLENALYDLQLLLTTREGRCHREREAADALRAAGFREVAVRDPGLAEEERIVTGIA
ncbi:MAG TPA: methyltransferase [Planctomycetota bacterium]|nr:methyltransferase [Planctomycetota bacterium]